MHHNIKKQPDIWGNRLTPHTISINYNSEILSFLTQIPIASCIACEEKILFTNDFFIELTGYNATEIHPLDFSTVFPVDQNQFVYENLANRNKNIDKNINKNTDNKVAASGDAIILTSQSHILYVSVKIQQIEVEENPCKLYYIEDISDNRTKKIQLEELIMQSREQEAQLMHSTRLAELGEMAAAIAHEINQPLTSIRNFARNALYMLDNGIDTPGEVQANLKTITEQVDRAGRIISQMRELARKSDKQIAGLNINNIIQETIAFLKNQFELANITINLHLSDSLPKIKGDRISLQQVLLNILTNARQAMENSPTRILTIKTMVQKPSIVSIVIKDTGPGFNEDQKLQLFKPFYTTKEPGKGTGLGLSISLRLIKDLGGTIDAVSSPKQGAEFIIQLQTVQYKEITQER